MLRCLCRQNVIVFDGVVNIIHNRCARRIFRENEGSLLYNLASFLTAHRSVEEEISRCIISEDEIFDGASPALSRIRRAMRAANERVRERLNAMIRSATYQKYLQEPIITIRQDRYVVPVKSEHRGEIPGLIHDLSSSGATVFVEPMQVVELNNEIRMLASKEEQDKLVQTVFTEKGTLNRKCVGRDAKTLLKMIGVTAPENTRCIIFEGPKEHKLISEELMMPILGIVRCKDIDDGIEKCVWLEHGNRHSAHMHSKNVENLTRYGQAMDTAIFVKNAPSYAALGFGGEGF